MGDAVALQPRVERLGGGHFEILRNTRSVEVPAASDAVREPVRLVEADDERAGGVGQEGVDGLGRGERWTLLRQKLLIRGGTAEQRERAAAIDEVADEEQL